MTKEEKMKIISELDLCVPKNKLASLYFGEEDDCEDAVTLKPESRFETDGDFFPEDLPVQNGKTFWEQKEERWKLLRKNPDLLMQRLKELLPENGFSESFSDKLQRLIWEKNMSPAECYNAANLDRRLYCKIKRNRYYTPEKNTVFAFILALRLNRAEADDLLKSAGYAFSDGSVTDVIIARCIKKGVYDVFSVNGILYKWGQTPLGTKSD